MFNFLTKSISKIFGTKSEKDIKTLNPFVDATNNEFKKLNSLSNDEFRVKTQELKEYINQKLAYIDDEVNSLKFSAEFSEEISIDEKEIIFKKIDELEL